MKSIRRTLIVFASLLLLGVPAFSQTFLTGLDGSRVDVQGQKGKVVVLAIGASWLPLSAKQAEYASAIARKYQGRDVVVYFVATDSTRSGSKNYASDESLKSFAVTSKLGVTVLRDADGSLLLKKFNVDQMPSFIVLDRSGSLFGEAFGGIDPKTDPTSQISRAVDKLLG
jgi:hypothetical protein